ncbi:MAG: class I SAM-dependent methyltransferase [Eubacterium sp.]|nr:class I SAM-dependent methyltransferase [Eubacterium sp.]
MMSSYVTLARYYDSLTENADYKVRSDYISNFFSRYGSGEKTLLDLACGSGSLSQHLAQKGYEIIGIDLSEDMLVQANSKNIKNAIFAKGDMKDFELPYNVNYCVSSLDSINHLKDIDEVESCFKCVYSALNENGIFVFDVNTLYKNEVILGNNTFVYDEEDYFLSWDNVYIGDGVVSIFLDFFIYNGKSYDRYSENFEEKAYETDEISNLLNNTGFEIIGIYNELTEEEPEDKSERIFFVCKRK